MSSFYQVSSGNPTLAADANQYANGLNGTVSTNLFLLAASSGHAIDTNLSSAPASDTDMITASLASDTVDRASMYIRGSDGYGGWRAGPGGSTAFTATWYAQSSGWKTDQSVTIGQNLTVAGASNLAGVSTTGNLSVGGNMTISGTVSSLIATTAHLWVNQKTTYGTSAPAIDLAVGDNDTGIDWLNDGQFALVSQGAQILVVSAGACNFPITPTISNNPIPQFINVSGGARIFVDASDPAGTYTTQAGDVWIKDS